MHRHRRLTQPAICIQGCIKRAAGAGGLQLDCQTGLHACSHQHCTRPHARVGFPAPPPPLRRVGIQHPTIEVRYKGVSVETSAVIGDRRIPTLVRTVSSRVEVSTGLLCRQWPPCRQWAGQGPGSRQCSVAWWMPPAGAAGTHLLTCPHDCCRGRGWRSRVTPAGFKPAAVVLVPPYTSHALGPSTRRCWAPATAHPMPS